MPRQVPDFSWDGTAPDFEFAKAMRRLCLAAKDVIERQLLHGVLKQLTQQSFTKIHDGASVGMHCRHLLQHYQALLAAVYCNETAYYDRRIRGSKLENDLQFAEAECLQILDGVEKLQLKPERLPICVAFEIGIDDSNEYAMNSFLDRELAFVNHHSVHHLALVKYLVGRDHKFSEDFGVATSTLKQRRNGTGSMKVGK